MSQQKLAITDNRTGNSYELPIQDATIRATDLRQIKESAGEFGMMSYDPAFMNTAACRSSVTFLDGDKGILRYRGYPIEVLAEHCTFLEVAYLLIFGELPTREQFEQWKRDITTRSMIHENFKKFLEGFHYDAHPMGILTSGVAALSTYYPEAKNIGEPGNRIVQTTRMIAKMPILAAYSYRHRLGLPYVQPDHDLGYIENFMNMLWKRTELKYLADPIIARALDIIFLLHADHEQNCSTSTMRAVGSSHADPYLSCAGACAALAGPLHGGANEAVLKMLGQIGHVKNIPAYIDRVKSGELKLMGFGHRVYKNYDPRARVLKGIADDVFKVTGRNPALDIALELEKIALHDDYFVKRKLYPNVDFYSGILLQAMNFDPQMFTVLFAIARVAGWMAQWLEMIQDPEQKIARPRQIYTGDLLRDFVPMEKRGAGRPTEKPAPVPVG